MNKYWKFFKLFSLSLIIILIQLSFLNSLPGFWGKINIVLFFVVWFFIFNNFDKSLLFVLITGFILDIFSFYPFGIYSISFLLTLILASFIWNNFFTNRSIYSFLSITAVFSIFYNLFLYFLLFLFEKSFLGLFWFNKFFWFNLLLELAWLSVGIILSFYFLNSQKRSHGALSFDKRDF